LKLEEERIYEKRLTKDIYGADLDGNVVMGIPRFLDQIKQVLKKGTRNW
jgi:hypothetical protein